MESGPKTSVGKCSGWVIFKQATRHGRVTVTGRKKKKQRRRGGVPEKAIGPLLGLVTSTCRDIPLVALQVWSVSM